ncbi:MAG: SDR family NAD(P)-dependent oxidoreductase [Bacteroidales bacterium]|jgi:NAD(P)-dependent dehydrogenase (short-subunit alcohol dehydrogenase family)|nr:SDR family NAD(P)-dependent oxidoreductase [Bacteroidales bacterium]
MNMYVKGRVLITGGTSGLGLELVKLFLRRGFDVVATGRRKAEISECESRFTFYRVDFSDLAATAKVFGHIFEAYNFDYMVYNAGILSPPDYRVTKDGFEYTFQINFLSHFLVNGLVIRHHPPDRPLRIVSVTSLAYRYAEPDFKHFGEAADYSAWKAYSNSKYYLVLMCRNFSRELAGTRMRFYSYDPGVFGSELYRTQKGIFRRIYQTGVKVLRKPAVPAGILTELLADPDLINGALYDVKKRIRKFTEPETDLTERFWQAVQVETAKFLQSQ